MPHKLPFRVVHVTCQDENYPATELNHHSPATRGWVSSRFCTFPQQLIFVLEERAHLRKIQVLSHQYLIASKIEFFVGDLRDDDIRHYENARYTRLGYVSLSDNRSTEFKARELKSVHVDAMGTFVQLLLHKNYTNEHNLYNQVGLIAINLIGDPVRKFPGSTNVLSGSSGATNRPDFIPPTEDLAFDIYQDPEVANIIRKLEKQKQACVSQEKFDEAQKIRDAIGYLHRVGERLGRLALEKQQAVEEENYERAKLKKFQISELRTNLYKDLDLINLLSQDIPLVGRVQANGDCADPLFTYESDAKSKVKRPDPIRLQALQELSMQTVLTQSTTETNRARSPSPNRRHSSSPSRRGTLHPMDPDERPLPALHRQQDSRSSVSVTKPTEPDYDDRTLSDQVSIMSVDPSSALDLPVLVPTIGASGQGLAPIEDEGTEAFESEEWGDEQQNSGQEHESRPSVPTNPVTAGQHSNQLEPLSESNRRLASVAIDAVGLEMVTMALSKVWAFREKALLELEKRVTAPQLLPPASQPDSAEPDPRGELRAITFLMKRALEDQVLSIFRLAVHFLKPLVIDFVERYMIPRPELHYALDKLLPVLFRRTGDTAVRIREVAKKQVLSMAQWPQLRQSTAYWNEVLRPFSTVTLDRLALSRMELVTELYAARGIDSAPLPSSEPTGGGSHNGFTLEAVVFFTAQALTHRSNEVREAAENLMVALYRAENRSMIRSCLPSADDVKTQRHPLYRRLLGKFERIDIKYAPVDAPPNGAVPDATKKQKDLEALQAEVQQVRAMIQAGVSRAHASPARAERGRLSKVKPVKQRPSNMRQSNPPSSTHAHALTRSETEATTKTKGATTATRQSPRSPRRVPSRPADSAPQDWSDTGPMPPGQLTSEAELLLTLDKTCIFCGERNEQFTEEGLDLHYWKDCPMLHRCTNCKQVVEIAGMVEHLLHECEAAPPGHYIRCTRCSEAVLHSELDSHPCIPTVASGAQSSSHVRCPLCHTDLPILPTSSAVNNVIAPGGPEDIWKSHLLGGDHLDLPPCSHNPRRPVQTQQAVHIRITSNGSVNVVPKPSRLSTQSPRMTQPSPSNKMNSQTREQKNSVPQKSGIPRPTYQSHVRPV